MKQIKLLPLVLFLFIYWGLEKFVFHSENVFRQLCRIFKYDPYDLRDYVSYQVAELDEDYVLVEFANGSKVKLPHDEFSKQASTPRPFGEFVRELKALCCEVKNIK